MSTKGSGGLGKGLDALLGNTVSSELAPKTNKAGLEQLNLDQLVPNPCLLYTSPSPRDGLLSRMPSYA